MSKGGLGRLVRQTVVKAIQPLCIEIDEFGRVSNCLGQPAYYGYPDLHVGAPADESLEFLIGIEPPTTIAYPFLTTPNQRCARVSVHFAAEHRYVVLLEVSESSDRERRLQLAVNAHMLSQSRVDKTLRKLAEISDRMEHVQQNFRWIDRRRLDALNVLRTQVLPLTLANQASHSDTAIHDTVAGLITLLDDGRDRVSADAATVDAGPACAVAPVVGSADAGSAVANSNQPVSSGKRPSAARIWTAASKADVLILHTRKDGSQSLLHELVVRGFSVAERAFDAVAPEADVPVDQPKLTVLACATVDEGKQAITLLRTFEQQWTGRPPVVVVGLTDTYELRLLARRLGAHTFFSGPIRPTALAAQLSEIIDTEVVEKCRVLLLTRDTDFELECIKTALQEDVHMLAEKDTRRALTTIVEQQVQAVIVDAVANQVEATDLIQMLRQHESLFAVPIIALIEGHAADAPVEYLSTAADECCIKWKDQRRLMRSLIARAQRFQRVRVRSRSDVVTGLLNRAAFLESFDVELERVNRGQTVSCLALCDIDYFKAINDTFGHLAGDAVLRHISKLLFCRLRKTDVVARYAGDEFVVLLPDSPLQQAQDLMNELRLMLQDTVVAYAESAVRFTISCGLQELRREGDKLLLADYAIHAADELLYEAKRAGRNRVCSSH